MKPNCVPKTILITAIGLLILVFAQTLYAGPCDRNPDYCDRNGEFKYQCAVPFSTENGSVKCHITPKTIIICSVTEFSNITTDFEVVPTLDHLSKTFSKRCYKIQECAAKFQCTRVLI